MTDSIESMTHRIIKNAVNAITELENDLIALKEQMMDLNRRYNILHEFTIHVKSRKDSLLSIQADEALKRLDRE